MATMTWASVPLPLPGRDGIAVQRELIGSSRRMASGILRIDYVATKAKIAVKWDGLSVAEWNDLYEAWATYQLTAATLVLPSGQEFVVVAGHNMMSESQYYDANDAVVRDVSITFEEV